MPSFFFHIMVDVDPSAFDTSKPTPKAGNTATLRSQQSNVDLTSSTGLFHDWRYSKTSLETIAMVASSTTEQSHSHSGDSSHMARGIGNSSGNLATRGSFEPSDSHHQEVGWGVVRLYRDSEETPGLYDEPRTPKQSKGARHGVKKDSDETTVFKDEDCTTLCILAVPSYLTPSDFLGFVGERTRDEVSHFRMIRSERSNRYMVLMRFRQGKRAREWRREWNGKAFDDMGSENCQVVFVKSISLRTPSKAHGQMSSFPDMSNDPFTPSITTFTEKTTTTTTAPAGLHSSHSTPLPPPSRAHNKPAPPPTPALIEMPTCPVCLERMDESTGLLTILCQHVFHCSCLQKWKGSGCPVCRYTHSSFPSSGKRNNHTNGTLSAEGASDQAPNECSICHSDDNLWICLICGNVGCGRYDGAHAFQHYEQTAHCFAMDMTTQRVWDYASDHYVHRIIQDQTDGKFVELTHPSDHDSSFFLHHQQRHQSMPDAPNQLHSPTDDADDDENDLVPRSKLNSIGLEYTALLTSQLDSQRSYYEEILHRSADKTSLATATAESASASVADVTAQLATLRHHHDRLVSETLPAAERDRDRALKRADRFETMARRLEKEWRDEKAMSESLIARVEGLEGALEGLQRHVKELEEEKRDLAFFISGGEKLRQLTSAGAGDGGGSDNERQRRAESTEEADTAGRSDAAAHEDGKLEREDVVGGTVVIPAAKDATDKTKARKGKGKGRR